MFCAVPLLFLALAGCSSSVVRVTGTLSYKGKPVTNAYIHFQPESGRQSWAQTDEQGWFKVNYDKHQDGAVVGKHKIWVEMRPITTAEKEAILTGKRPSLSADMMAFFDKYSAEKSTLTAEITPNNTNLKLDLD
jgi:hypothetical protein